MCEKILLYVKIQLLKWQNYDNLFLGTFLLIYFIAMFGCGIPIFFQEVATGQYLGSGGLTMIGQLVPMLQGTYHIFNITIHIDIVLFKLSIDR